MADQLYEFACSYLDNHPIWASMPATGPESRIAEICANLLFREGQFQVQMFTLPPNYIIPAHVHPNVDSFEVYVSGQIKLSHRGQYVFETKGDILGADEVSYKWRMLRVKPEDRHGGIVGPQGARFMSIQHWLHDVAPHCIACDYSGPVMDPEHLALIKFGAAIARSQQDLDVSETL